MGHHHLKQLLPTCFVSVLMISLSSGVTDDALHIICSQTQNEEICVRILESDSRTLFATLPELSLISINLTKNQATSNFKNFTKLRDNSRALPLKSSYDHCVTLYRLMFQKLSKAYVLSRKGQYKEISQLGEAQDLAYRCENGLPSNSSTAAISETMILTSEASASVNLYIANTVPQVYESERHA